MQQTTSYYSLEDKEMHPSSPSSQSEHKQETPLPEKIVVYNLDDKCPITNTSIEEIPDKDRVIFFDGYIYEKAALLQWINTCLAQRKNPSSPMDNTEIKDETIEAPQPVTFFNRTPTNRKCLGRTEIGLGVSALLCAVGIAVTLTKVSNRQGDWAVAGMVLGLFLSLGTCVYRIRRQNQQHQTYIPPSADETHTTLVSEATLMHLYRNYITPFAGASYIEASKKDDVETGQGTTTEDHDSITISP